MEESFKLLEADYQEGQDKLEKMATAISIRSFRYGLAANLIKVVLIITGTLAALDTLKFFGRDWSPNKATLGVLVTILTGILSAFQFDERANELRLIAVSVQSLEQKVRNQWNKVCCPQNSENALKALEYQDEQTAALMEKAAQHMTITKSLILQKKAS